MRVLREIIVTLTIAMAMFIALQLTIQSSVVVGRSMEPSFQHGQRLVVSKVAYAFGEPARGDVIIFHPPSSQRTEYIKRIIGLPGDTVEIKNGTVIVNGESLEEAYIENPPLYTLPPQVVPENSYFVLGDNRNNSNDSHNWGSVSRKSIVGKGWLSIWPPGEWGLIPNYLLSE